MLCPFRASTASSSLRSLLKNYTSFSHQAADEKEEEREEEEEEGACLLANLQDDVLLHGQEGEGEAQQDLPPNEGDEPDHARHCLADVPPIGAEKGGREVGGGGRGERDDQRRIGHEHVTSHIH